MQIGTPVLATILSALALFAGSACRPRESEVRSTPPPTAGSASDTGPKRFDRFAELDSFVEVSRIRTAHPVGDLAATIKVDEAAAGYGQSGRPPLPVGATIVEVLAVAPDAPPSLYYVMRRREAGYFTEGGDWEYGVVGPDGMVRTMGKLTLCARCHGEAPREHLFEHIVKRTP